MIWLQHLIKLNALISIVFNSYGQVRFTLGLLPSEIPFFGYQSLANGSVHVFKICTFTYEDVWIKGHYLGCQQQHLESLKKIEKKINELFLFLIMIFRFYFVGSPFSFHIQEIKGLDFSL